MPKLRSLVQVLIWSLPKRRCTETGYIHVWDYACAIGRHVAMWLSLALLWKGGGQVVRLSGARGCIDLLDDFDAVACMLGAEHRLPARRNTVRQMHDIRDDIVIQAHPFT